MGRVLSVLTTKRRVWYLRGVGRQAWFIMRKKWRSVTSIVATLDLLVPNGRRNQWVLCVSCRVVCVCARARACEVPAYLRVHIGEGESGDGAHFLDILIFAGRFMRLCAMMTLTVLLSLSCCSSAASEAKGQRSQCHQRSAPRSHSRRACCRR